MRQWLVAGGSLLACVSLSAGSNGAELVVSANDGRAILVNGAAQVAQPVRPDTVSIIDIAANPPRILFEIEAPASVVGPPQSVAVAPDESIALVTGATKLDPADASKTVPDDKLSVIDLKSSPPRVVATLQAGRGAAGVSINRAGTLALVANRAEGTVSIFTIANGTLTPAGKLNLGDDKSGPSHALFTRDGKMALVSRDNDHKISVLSVLEGRVEYTKRDINPGLRPYSMDTAGAGDTAVVGNVGVGQGDADTISIIDLKAKPPRVANTVSVGQTPEGVKMSPDGNFVAVTVMNGSNKAKESPFFNDHGLLRVYRLSGTDAAHVADAPIGHWCQGAAWSKDSRRILAQCMVEGEIAVFDFDGKTLTRAGAVKVSGNPAGIRTAEP